MVYLILISLVFLLLHKLDYSLVQVYGDSLQISLEEDSHSIQVYFLVLSLLLWPELCQVISPFQLCKFIQYRFLSLLIRSVSLCTLLVQVEIISLTVPTF